MVKSIVYSLSTGSKLLNLPDLKIKQQNPLGQLHSIAKKGGLLLFLSKKYVDKFLIGSTFQ
jgi:hypothetical protein